MFQPGNHQYRLDQERRNQLAHEASRERLVPKSPSIRISLRPFYIVLAMVGNALFRTRPAFRVRPRIQ